MQITIDLKKLDKKKKAKSTLVIKALKNFGVRGDLARWYFTQNSPEWIMRKCWMLDYYIDIDRAPKNKTAWLKAAIKHDYVEPEGFHEWFRRKKEKILNGSNDDLKQLILE